jgi:hypothetical protein
VYFPVDNLQHYTKSETVLLILYVLQRFNYSLSVPNSGRLFNFLSKEVKGKEESDALISMHGIREENNIDMRKHLISAI